VLGLEFKQMTNQRLHLGYWIQFPDESGFAVLTVQWLGAIMIRKVVGIQN
jgi:hypothetical protein